MLRAEDAPSGGIDDDRSDPRLDQFVNLSMARDKKGVAEKRTAIPREVERGDIHSDLQIRDRDADCCHKNTRYPGDRTENSCL